MSQTVNARQLQPKIWRHDAGKDDQGYIQAANDKSTPVKARERLGYLLAIIHGIEEVDGRRLLSTLFSTYYQDTNRAPIEALRLSLANLDKGVLPEPEMLLLAVQHHDRLYLSHRGVGYAYLWREGKVYLLADGQAETKTDVYRPIIIQAQDRLLLCNARLATLVPDRQDLAKLLSGPGPSLLEATMRQKQTTNVSLLLAQFSAVPSSKITETALTRWQWATWAILSVIALIELVALLALRW